MFIFLYAGMVSHKKNILSCNKLVKIVALCILAHLGDKWGIFWGMFMGFGWDDWGFNWLVGWVFRSDRLGW